MELLNKIISITYYIYHRKKIIELRRFCKMFLDNNILTANIGYIYSDKAVRNFYSRLISKHPQFVDQISYLYDEELIKYDEIRELIDRCRELSKRAYLSICNVTSPLNVCKEVIKCGGMEKFINTQHRFIQTVFDDVESIFYSMEDTE